jgi:outer membrane protein TolC
MAFEQRPELRRIQIQRETINVELAWARNQTLPALNGFLASGSDIGRGKPNTGPSRLDRATLEAGIELQLPIQRRDARGRVLAAEAELVRLAQQEQFAQDSIRAEVQATFANLERAYEFYRQSATRVALAREVADIARKDFAIGGGDVLRITLLEQQEFQSILTEVTARFDYFRALAEYQAALGIGATPR